MAARYLTVGAIQKTAAGSYSATALSMEVTVHRAGTLLAREQYSIARSGDTWGALTTLGTNAFNADQLSATVSVVASVATVTATWNVDNTTTTGVFTVVSDGVQGPQGPQGPQGVAGVTSNNTQPFMGWNSGDNGGTYSPGTQTSSITFKQGTTQLAATTITGTITQSTGNITLASSSTSGSPTITFSNNGTANPTATISKDGSETAVSAFAINLGNLGGK